jgi:hypothetical protein
MFTIENNNFNCTIWLYFQKFDLARTGRSEKPNCILFPNIPHRYISWLTVRRDACYIRHKRSFQQFRWMKFNTHIKSVVFLLLGQLTLYQKLFCTI